MIAAVITWALSELVVRRLRLVLPGILLACVFSYFAVAAFSHDWPWLIARLGLPSTLVPRFGSPYSPDVYFYPPVLRANAFVVSCAATLFYARFKLPFALLLIAAGLVVFAQAGVWYYSTLGMSFTSIVLLVSGLAVFGAAMAYDLSDRDRVTRRADCAFWLHLLAAPLIVHSLIQLLVPSVIFGQLATSMTIGAALIVVGVIAALTIVALLIDRRALFVSALSYLGIVIGYTITSARGNWQGSESFVIFSTLLILGALVLSLGVTWQPLRRVFIRLFPTSLTNRLPRVAPA
ncbi:MAG TPA: hypothetical protein VMH84_14915 [Xanthobacteraceae bacterium]|nr:hypothetical protein [Xanthobacteraceae bacterium]